MIGRIAHNFLLRLPPETAHSVAKGVMRTFPLFPGEYSSQSPTDLFGATLRNPLGIAAGFDKYAELADVVKRYGFSWIEEGSFTWEGGKGNPGKRLFRLPNGGLLNRMGLNCISSAEAADILRLKDQDSFAVSIAKTHNPNIIGDKAIEDLVGSYSSLGDLGIYTAINLSCPNTKEGKTFEEPGSLLELLVALGEVRRAKPKIIKFSPGLSREVLIKLIETSEPYVDGYEAVNTLSRNHPLYGKGGESGPDIHAFAIGTVATIREVTSKPIIGVGGIRSGWNMYNLRKAGANAFLVYTGFVYGSKYSGPNFSHRVLAEFDSLCREEQSQLKK